MARILVIDDDPAMRRMVSRILADAGYEVIEAKDGREALKQMAAFDPVVIVTDIVMPEMEGIEFILHVRKLQPGAKVIAMSGGGKAATRELFLRMAKSLGADTVLEKPFGADTLLDAVRNLLPAT